MKKLRQALLPMLLPVAVCAEIITDGSLGSATTLTGPDFLVTADLGQRRGRNLFHSFSQFNIAADESATFRGSADIANIINRVTGGGTSTIDGALRSNISDANLFLLNPAGVIVGANATLDIGGSLHISSADYLVLDDTTRFMATPQAGEVLTAAAPLAFGFLGESNGSVRIRGSQLTLNSGSTLNLAANGIVLRNASVDAGQGGIQFTSLASAGEVAVDTGVVNGDYTGADVDLNGAEISNANSVAINGGTVQLRNNAFIDSSTEGVADGVLIAATDLQIQGESYIRTESLGENNGGSIGVTTDRLRIVGDGSDDSNAGIHTLAQDTADAGSISVQATTIELLDGGAIDSRSLAAGNAGDIAIQTDDLVMSGEGPEFYTGIFSIAESDSSGNAGNILLTADHIEVREGAEISSSTHGGGNAGNVDIHAGRLLVAGDGAATITAISSDARSGSAGNAAAVTIQATDVEVLSGGFIRSSTFGTGNAGQVAVTTEQLLVDGGIIGSSAVSISRGAANAGEVSIQAVTVEVVNNGFIRTNTSGRGDAGLVTVVADELVVSGGSLLSRTAATGNAGNIVVNAGTIAVRNGGLISAFTSAAGNAGAVTVQGDHLLIADDGASGSTGITSDADQDSTGNAGTLTIQVNDIELLDGGTIGTSTFGEGDAGLVTVVADRLLIDSGILASSAPSSSRTGNAGEISLRANTIEVLNQGAIRTNTAGRGSAGLVTVSTDKLLIDGGSLLSRTSSSGNAGSIVIDGGEIGVRNAGIISANTSARGDAGNLAIHAESLAVGGSSASIDTSTVAAGNAGNISIEAGVMALTESGSISSKSTGGGRAGSIEINVTGDVSLVQSLITTETIDGFDPEQPASIALTARNLLLEQNSAISTNASGTTADAGNIHLGIDDSIRLLTNSRLSTESTGGGGGQITVLTDELLYLSDSAITTSVAQGQGNGGDIFVDPVFILLDNSQIIANAVAGNGGNITLIADYIIRSNDSRISASSQLGIDGEINIQALDTEVDTGEDNLSTDYLNAENWAQQACFQRAAGGFSSFILGRPNPRPSPHDDWSTSPMGL